MTTFRFEPEAPVGTRLAKKRLLTGAPPGGEPMTIEAFEKGCRARAVSFTVRQDGPPSNPTITVSLVGVAMPRRYAIGLGKALGRAMLDAFERWDAQ